MACGREHTGRLQQAFVIKRKILPHSTVGGIAAGTAECRAGSSRVSGAMILRIAQRRQNQHRGVHFVGAPYMLLFGKYYGPRALLDFAHRINAINRTTPMADIRVTTNSSRIALWVPVNFDVRNAGYRNERDLPDTARCARHQIENRAPPFLSGPRGAGRCRIAYNRCYGPSTGRNMGRKAA